MKKKLENYNFLLVGDKVVIMELMEDDHDPVFGTFLGGLESVESDAIFLQNMMQTSIDAFKKNINY